MICFYHQDRAAVGTCKACSKGLCAACAADLGHGLACKGQHEQRVTDIENMVSHHALALKNGNKTSMIAPALYFFMGALFLAIGLFRSYNIEWFSVILGGGFMVFALITYFNNRAFWRKKA